ncbi:MAG TPA: hypothetical protein ENJ42_06165 [Hellea balneolensis]|uniref:Uncharacterized protein n=1 Tax=Hellea balneolensis TaxID=287478 RepID=A0A7C5R0Z9_9PROT|nr:hypothetical protein [Hellea balneolensis]
MRYLLCGVATIALSGCSWLGIGQNHHGQYKHANSDHAYTKANDGCCVGGKTLSRWNVEAGVGPEFNVGGDVITGDQTHPGFTNTNINNLSYNDAYDTGMRYELGGSYALNPNRKLTGQVYYSNANGKDVVLGSRSGDVIRGALTDYESYGLEMGLRQYAQPTKVPLLKSVRPYVEGKVGAAHVDDIGLTNVRRVGSAIPAGNIGFYEGGWVPTAAGMIGVETPVLNRFTMGVETGVRYTGKLKSDTSGMGGPGGFDYLGGSNNGGGRWTVPLTLRGRYRF